MGKTSLFELFTDELKYTITDGSREVPILIRSLTYGEQIEMFAESMAERAKAEARFDTQDFRTGAANATRAMTKELLVDRLLMMEGVVASANADLAPLGPDGEKRTMEQWIAIRRGQIEATDEEVVRSMVVDRGVRIAIDNQANNRFMELSMVTQILDPETRDPLFSADQTSPNYINRLQPGARGQISDAFNDFLGKVSEKATRTATQNPGFLSYGASPSGPGATPGETIETPSPSPSTLSVSTPSATG